MAARLSIALATLACVALLFAPGAHAQCIDCPPSYSVAVTPDGVSTPTRLLNTSGYSAVFTIENTGNAEDTYNVSCAGSSNVTCTGTSASSVVLGAGASTTVTAFYNVGAAGTGEITLAATSNNAFDAGYYTVPVAVPGMSVTPDAGTAPDRAAHTGGYTQAFTVQNTGGISETFNITCGGSSNVTCTGTSAPSVTLGAGASTSVTATYSVSNGGTGALTLTATSVNVPSVADVGSVGITVILPAGAPRVNASVYNAAMQDYGRCAQACFAVVHAQSTVPYVSLDVPRSVTLAYNSDRHQPRPFVHVNVDPDGGYGATPTEYRLQVKVNGVFVTFVNGEQTLRFAYGPGTRRIGGQFDATSYATGVYPMDIVVSALYPDNSLISTVTSTKFVAVNEGSSPVAVGWTVAGIQRAFATSDGSVLITTGDGGARFFQKSSGVDPFVSPPGEFSRLVTGTPSGAAGWTRLFPDSTKVVFNNLGRMVEVRDRFNNVATVTYDGSGRVSQVKDPLNLAITLAYNANGLSTITDPAGRVTTITVDASRRLTAIRDPDNVSTSFGYDASQRLLTITNRRGHTSTLGYDAQSAKLASVTAPAIPYVGTNGADSTGSPVTTLAAWQKVGVPYGGTGTPVAAPLADTVYARVTDPGGHVTRFSVNRWGTPIQITDPLGRATTATYDANGLPIQVAYPTGVKDTMGYNASGLPTHVRLAGRDSATYIRYAAWAQPDSVWGFQVPPVRSFIGANGRVDSTRTWGAAGAAVTRFVYETRGRVERVTDAENHLAGRTWYAGTNGNRSRDSLPGGRVTTHAYDAYGRQTSVSAPGVNQRVAAYDLVNRVLKDSIAGMPPTVYAYDALFLNSVTDPKGQVYRFAYNGLGWTTARTDPANHADTLRYDREGLVRRWKNRRLEVIRYHYDVGHRPTGKGGTNTDSTTSSYSGDTLVVSASPWAVDSQFRDAAGALDSVRTRFLAPANQTFVQRFWYMTGGRLDSVGISGGGIAFLARKYTWNVQSGALNTIRLGGGGSTTISGNRDGQTIEIVGPGGDGWTTIPTAVHDPAQISTGAPYAQTVNRYLSFDAGGRMFRQVYGDGLNGWEFAYDGLGRLTAATPISAPAPSPCEPPNIIDENGNSCVEGQEGAWVTVPGGSTFSYDSVGNRRDQGGDYGPGNRIRQFAGCTYVTDSLGDGNVLSRTCGTETVRFHWTAESRLKALKVVGADSIDFRYDASGRLVRKDVNTAVQTYFLWQGENLLAELNASATGKVAEYSYYPGLDNPHAVIVGTTPYFAHVDGKGNVIALTDSATKTVQRSYDFDSWGGLTGGSDVKPFANADRARFKGALWLGPEADLYYMQARWYEPKTGRFLSEDPIGLEGGINPYGYAGGDPINGRDPSGLDGSNPCPSGYELRNPEGTDADGNHTDNWREFCVRGDGDYFSDARYGYDALRGGTPVGWWWQGAFSPLRQEGCRRGFSASDCQKLRAEADRLVRHTNSLCQVLGRNARRRIAAGRYIYLGEAPLEGWAFDLQRVAEGSLPASRGRIGISASGMALLASTMPHEEYHYYAPESEHGQVYAVGFSCAQ